MERATVSFMVQGCRVPERDREEHMSASLHWHALEAESVIERLRLDPRNGLSADEVARRQAQFGANALPHQQPASPWALFFAQFKNVLIVILIVATGLSALAGEYVDAVIIIAIVVFCAVLGFVQEYRAERALDALKGMLVATITTLRDGREQETPSTELVPGDVVLLEAGDRIPADARLIENHSLACDEAALTGESQPVAKALAAVPAETAVPDRACMVFTGTSVTFGRAKAVVTETGMRTEMGKIAREVAVAEHDPTPLERRTREIGKWLGLITLAICALVIGASIARDFVLGEFSVTALLPIAMFAIALAVAAVPEALPAIVTGALAIAMRDMARRNALVRRMPAVETLGCVSVICTDKTGTLTKGEMTVRRAYAGGRMIDVSGSGYAPQGAIDADVEDPCIEALLQAAVLANDASVVQDASGRWTVRGDPTEGALVVLAGKGRIDAVQWRARAPRIEEWPFSSERKRMTTVHIMPDGRRIAFMKGAPEVVLPRCVSVREGGVDHPLDPVKRAALQTANADMASQALRVLALACKTLEGNGVLDEDAVERGMILLGYVGMMDPPRDETRDAVATCRAVGIIPVMITGDHRLTATAVAREIGIFRDGDRVLGGEELAAMDEAELAAVVEKVSVYARVAPLDKLKIVRAWKSKGHVVAMTGDGVNDAPALKHADIGVAMGLSGTDVAKESADIVLADDNFATIVVAIERGRWIYDNIKKYLAYLLRTNITEVIVLGGVVLALGPQFLPLLPAAILYINLASDGLPALALGVAPPEKDIMTRPPRDPNESVFSFEVKTLVLLAVFIECPIFLWMFLSAMDDLEAARTRVFLMFLIIEMLLAVNFRSLRYSVFEAPPHKWLLIAITWEIGLIVLLLQFAPIRAAFGIHLPHWQDLGAVLAIGIAVMASMEAAKRVLRRWPEPAR